MLYLCRCNDKQITNNNFKTTYLNYGTFNWYTDCIMW